LFTLSVRSLSSESGCSKIAGKALGNNLLFIVTHIIARIFSLILAMNLCGSGILKVFT
jgi:hypothetical protein